MHTVVRLDDIGEAPATEVAVADAATQQVETATAQLTVETGNVLFQPGDDRRHYRVESGAIFHYVRWIDGSHDLIEVAFPGDIVGLGNLSTHISTAQAMVETVVSEVSHDAIGRLLETDDRLAMLLANAGEREFDYMRDVTLNSGKRTPVERVANYLMAVADVRADGRIVAEDISSGYVAERLQMDLDTLSSALVGLERKGLVTAANGGLKITDPAELERVANAA